MLISSRIGVVLRVRAIGDDEDLHVFIKSGGGPETVTLIALDLIKSFTDSDATSLELDVDEGQAIDEYGDIVASVMLAAVFLILVQDLQAVVMDVTLVDELNVLGRTIVPLEDLNMILLDLASLLFDTLVGTGQALAKEPLPFGVTERETVEQLKLAAQIGDKGDLRAYG